MKELYNVKANVSQLLNIDERSERHIKKSKTKADDRRSISAYVGCVAINKVDDLRGLGNVTNKRFSKWSHLRNL